jgi:prephenate dehydratase/chorismate mutase/prephenate dehydratase
MDLDEIRKRINTIDFEILKLLNSRMEFAMRTKKFKKDITDLKREHEVIDYIRKHSQGLIEPEFCKQLFLQIIDESKRIQSENRKLIGFQGEHGSFSEVAARLFDPNLIYISCSKFSEIFEGVETGLLHTGIVPVESTLGGAVTDVNEYLVATDLRIVGEVVLPIHYCLVVLPETRLRDVRVIYSHRLALSHCQQYLKENNLEGRPYHDTAAAAKMLLQERPKASAAIVSEFAADYYNLKILDRNIEDHHDNITRYVILASQMYGEPGDKCSVIFVTQHKVGALLSVLSEFADAGINLTRIESMPNRHDPGNYFFFLDFHGSQNDPQVQEVLTKVQSKTLTYRFLGCYPRARGDNENQIK